MFAALLGFVGLTPVSVEEVNVRPGSVVSISRREGYSATQGVSTKNGITISSDTIIKRMKFGEAEPTPLLDKRITDQWMAKLQAMPGTQKIFGNLRILQDRWLTASAHSSEKGVELARTYFVVDLQTLKTRTYEGFGNRVNNLASAVAAVGPDWIIVNIVPPMERIAPLPPAKTVSMIVSVKDGRETVLGSGSAAGIDALGRVYAADLVDARGRSVPDRTPNATPMVKVLDKDAWKTLGDGSVMSVRADGTLLVIKMLPSERDFAYFTVKDGKWTMLEKSWEKGIRLMDLGTDGTMLLHKPMTSRIMGALDCLIIKNGVTTQLADVLPENLEALGYPAMLADGTILVQGQLNRADKSYLVRAN
jgi:hypothetical protein